MNDIEQDLRRVLEHAAAPAGRSVAFEPIAVRARRRRQVYTAAGAAGTGLVTVALAATLWPGAGAAPVAGDSSGTTPTSSPIRSTGCPTSQGTTVATDYLDFVHFGGRGFRTDSPALDLPARLVGAQVGTVSCTLGTIQPGSNYRIQDGDAGHLPAGTQLFAVRGYPTSFRLAARVGPGKYVLYEVDSAPDAKRGKDLLPLGERVRRIDILDQETGTRVIGSVTDPLQIIQVVAGIMNAPVSDKRPSGAQSPIRFTLADGTTTRLWTWHRDASLLDQITLLPATNTILRNVS